MNAAGEATAFRAAIPLRPRAVRSDIERRAYDDLREMHLEIIRQVGEAEAQRVAAVERITALSRKATELAATIAKLFPDADPALVSRGPGGQETAPVSRAHTPRETTHRQRPGGGASAATLIEAIVTVDHVPMSTDELFTDMQARGYQGEKGGVATAVSVCSKPGGPITRVARGLYAHRDYEPRPLAEKAPRPIAVTAPVPPGIPVPEVYGPPVTINGHRVEQDEPNTFRCGRCKARRDRAEDFATMAACNG